MDTPGDVLFLHEAVGRSSAWGDCEVKKGGGEGSGVRSWDIDKGVL